MISCHSLRETANPSIYPWGMSTMEFQPESPLRMSVITHREHGIGALFYDFDVMLRPREGEHDKSLEVNRTHPYTPGPYDSPLLGVLIDILLQKGSRVLLVRCDMENSLTVFYYGYWRHVHRYMRHGLQQHGIPFKVEVNRYSPPSMRFLSALRNFLRALRNVQ